MICHKKLQMGQFNIDLYVFFHIYSYVFFYIDGIFYWKISLCEMYLIKIQICVIWNEQS